MNHPSPDASPTHAGPAAGPAAIHDPAWDALPGYQREFCQRLAAEPGVRGGRVLDIGCGPGLTERFRFLRAAAAELHGLDPGPDVLAHPDLDRRWQSTLEAADVPAGYYDVAYSYNVLEHVARPAEFLRAVHRALRPGGVYWALTPSARHPFVMMAWTAEALGLKDRIAARRHGVNDYPSPYRLNSPRAVRRAARGLGFRASFHFAAAPRWYRGYLPRLAWPPMAAYDAAVNRAAPGLRLIMMARLEKG